LPFAEELTHSREFTAALIARPPPLSMVEVVAMGAKDVLGREGEQAAVRYLEGCGFRILDRNWRSADGEIDIVAVERHTFVVCEVKTRSGTRFGTPLDAVGSAKRRRLRRLAAEWLAAHGIRFDQIRIDVVGLLRDGADGFTIEHVRGVG
jgi:putative endonuclease